MTVTEQNLPKPPASDNSKAVTKVGENANAKQTATSESRKPAKTEKKQGTGSRIIFWHLSFICLSAVGHVVNFLSSVNVRTKDIIFGSYLMSLRYVTE